MLGIPFTLTLRLPLSSAAVVASAPPFCGTPPIRCESVCLPPSLPRSSLRRSRSSWASPARRFLRAPSYTPLLPPVWTTRGRGVCPDCCFSSLFTRSLLSAAAVVAAGTVVPIAATLQRSVPREPPFRAGSYPPATRPPGCSAHRVLVGTRAWALRPTNFPSPQANPACHPPPPRDLAAQDGGPAVLAPHVTCAASRRRCRLPKPAARFADACHRDRQRHRPLRRAEGSATPRRKRGLTPLLLLTCRAFRSSRRRPTGPSTGSSSTHSPSRSSATTRPPVLSLCPLNPLKRVRAGGPCSCSSSASQPLYRSRACDC